jgi:tRNA-dihydrouridine synthase
LAAQRAIVGELYEDMLTHHGITIGRRHARKHLGWALDAAAATTAAPIELLRACRERVLTADDPGTVRCELAAAFDAIGSARGVGSSQGADGSSQKAAA